MIELTEKQVEALQIAKVAGEAMQRVVNPVTHEAFVLIPVDEYERLTSTDYDDSPWTREELELLTWEIAERENWEDYDVTPEKS